MRMMMIVFSISLMLVSYVFEELQKWKLCTKLLCMNLVQKRPLAVLRHGQDDDKTHPVKN
jgi:hypothetical protein